MRWQNNEIEFTSHWRKITNFLYISRIYDNKTEVSYENVTSIINQIEKQQQINLKM